MSPHTPHETASAAETGRGGAAPAPGETDPGECSTPRPLESLVLGLKGGAFATLVMTVFRMPISHSLPPTANFWARFVGNGDPDDYPIPAFVLHILYGIVGGGIFGVLYDRRRGQTRAGIELVDLARGLVYSLAFSAFGSRVVLRRLVGMDLEPDEALIFHVGHVIYGIALGAWVGSNR